MRKGEGVPKPGSPPLHWLLFHSTLSYNLPGLLLALLAISTLPTWPRSPEGSFFHPHPFGFLPVAFLWTLSTGLPLIQRLDNSPVSHQMPDRLLLFSGFSPKTPSSTTLSWQCWGLGRWHRPASFLTRHEQASAIPTHHILAGSMLSRLLISGGERRDFHCCGW